MGAPERKELVRLSRLFGAAFRNPAKFVGRAFDRHEEVSFIDPGEFGMPYRPEQPRQVHSEDRDKHALERLCLCR